MKRLAGLLLVATLCLGWCASAGAQARTTTLSQTRASRKVDRKQQKAMRKYAKTQRKAQRKMEKKDRKNTHYPPRSF